MDLGKVRLIAELGLNCQDLFPTLNPLLWITPMPLCGKGDFRQSYCVLGGSLLDFHAGRNELTSIFGWVSA